MRITLTETEAFWLSVLIDTALSGMDDGPSVAHYESILRKLNKPLAAGKAEG